MGWSQMVSLSWLLAWEKGNYTNKGTWKRSQGDKRSHIYRKGEIRRNLSAIKKFKFWEVIWITSWVYRFLENCMRKEKLLGPVERNETKKARVFWIKHEQRIFETTDYFKEEQDRLNLQKNGINLRMFKKNPYHYPVYMFYRNYY